MINIYEELTWLPNIPENFSEKLSLSSNFDDLHMLSKYSLDENQLRRIFKKFQILKKKQKNILPLIPMSMGIISNSLTNLLVPALVGTALRFGIALEIIETEFNQVAQETFSLKSLFVGKKIDVVLIAIDYRGLPFLSYPGDKISAEKNFQDCLIYIKTVIKSLQNKTGAQIIFQNFATPVDNILGSYEGQLPGTLTWLIDRLNNEFKYFTAQDAFILDINSLANNVGLINWHDLTLWNVAKFSFSLTYLPIYSDYICRILSASLGKSRRCLVLDLDNTLWGGVIGDMGIQGISIGNGNPTGEAFLELQRTVLELRQRGIVLAISSKNEDNIARTPFREHPDMLLQEDHFAIFQANWSDKASNIKTIAKTLSLGLESIVFLDDNPAERMQVRQELPEVAVPELPNDPALFGRTLIAAGYFEAINFSEEDRNRPSFYENNSKRAEILNESSDMNTYLNSLKMKLNLSPFNKSGRSRICQLINKSNQFNLTTKRYTEVDIKNFEKEKNYYTQQIRLRDIFGDNGMVSVIICKKEKNFWEIDTWLMSCRVLGRCVELAVLQDIINVAMKNGITKLIGIYTPTSRNNIVKYHYKNLGFKKISVNKNTEKWELDIVSYNQKEVPMEYGYEIF